MSHYEERDVLLLTGCPVELVDTILHFAERYRVTLSADSVLKNRKLGTRALVRISTRLSKYSGEDLYSLLARSLLVEFLPAVEKANIENLLDECGIKKGTMPVSRSGSETWFILNIS